jgi:hypothetical protein
MLEFGFVSVDEVELIPVEIVGAVNRRGDISI